MKKYFEKYIIQNKNTNKFLDIVKVNQSKVFCWTEDFSKASVFPLMSQEKKSETVESFPPHLKNEIKFKKVILCFELSDDDS